MKFTTVVEQDLFEQRFGFNQTTTTLEEVLISPTFFNDDTFVKS
jgi:hypothetical protein